MISSPPDHLLYKLYHSTMMIYALSRILAIGIYRNEDSDQSWNILVMGGQQWRFEDGRVAALLLWTREGGGSFECASNIRLDKSKSVDQALQILDNGLSSVNQITLDEGGRACSTDRSQGIVLSSYRLQTAFSGHTGLFRSIRTGRDFESGRSDYGLYMQQWNRRCYKWISDGSSLTHAWGSETGLMWMGRSGCSCPGAVFER